MCENIMIDQTANRDYHNGLKVGHCYKGQLSRAVGRDTELP